MGSWEQSRNHFPLSAQTIRTHRHLKMKTVTLVPETSSLCRSFPFLDLTRLLQLVTLRPASLSLTSCLVLRVPTLPLSSRTFCLRLLCEIVIFLSFIEKNRAFNTNLILLHRTSPQLSAKESIFI